jgi:hypothetical protein
MSGLTNPTSDRLTLTWQNSTTINNTQLRRLSSRRRSWVLLIVTQLNALNQGAWHLAALMVLTSATRLNQRIGCNNVKRSFNRFTGARGFITHYASTVAFLFSRRQLRLAGCVEYSRTFHSAH